MQKKVFTLETDTQYLALDIELNPDIDYDDMHYEYTFAPKESSTPPLIFTSKEGIHSAVEYIKMYYGGSAPKLIEKAKIIERTLS